VIEVRFVQRLVAAADGVGDFNIAHRGERGQQVEALEDKADALFTQAGALSVAERAKIDAVDDDPTRSGVGEATEQVEEGRFAGAGGADDGHKFTAWDSKRDAAYGGDFNMSGAINLGEIFGLDEGFG